MSFDRWRFTFGRKTKNEISNIPYSARSEGRSAFNTDINKPEYICTPELGSTFVPINVSINGGSTTYTGVYPQFPTLNAGQDITTSYFFRFGDSNYYIIWKGDGTPGDPSGRWELFKIIADGINTIESILLAQSSYELGPYPAIDSSWSVINIDEPAITSFSTSLYEDRTWTNEDCIIASSAPYECEIGRIVENRNGLSKDYWDLSTFSNIIGLTCNLAGPEFRSTSRKMIGVVYRDNIPSPPSSILVYSGVLSISGTFTWNGSTYFNEKPVYSATISGDLYELKRVYALTTNAGLITGYPYWAFFVNGIESNIAGYLPYDPAFPIGTFIVEGGDSFTYAVAPSISPIGSFRQIATQGLYPVKFGPNDTSCTIGGTVFLDQYNLGGFATQNSSNIFVERSEGINLWAPSIGICAVNWNSIEMAANNNLVPCYIRPNITKIEL